MSKKSAGISVARPEGEFEDFVVSGGGAASGESAPTAKKMAKSKLRKANKKENTADIDVVGDPRLVAGVTVTLKNFGSFDGKWIIEKAAHKVSKGYTTKLDLRRCLDGY